jgi:Rrf2 family protein
MRTNSSAEAALHIMLLLAAAPDSRELAANDLADFHNLVRGTLAKVLQQLAAAGLVKASAGRHGGYQLARAADTISSYDIAAAIDGVEPRFHCHEIRRNGPCAGSKSDYSARCAIARTMDAAAVAWADSLKAVSLADLVVMTSGDVAPSIKQRTNDWFSAHMR